MNNENEKGYRLSIDEIKHQIRRLQDELVDAALKNGQIQVRVPFPDMDTEEHKVFLKFSFSTEDPERNFILVLMEDSDDPGLASIPWYHMKFGYGPTLINYRTSVDGHNRRFKTKIFELPIGYAEYALLGMKKMAHELRIEVEARRFRNDQIAKTIKEAVDETIDRLHSSVDGQTRGES